MSKRLFPVIHIKDSEQAIRNCGRAIKAGCDGVFLIHHKKSYKHLFTVAEVVHKCFPNLWIGTNALDLGVGKAFELTPNFVKGIWCDDSGVVETATEVNADWARIQWHTKVLKRDPRVEYFGGFAFKYQTPIYSLEQGAQRAAFCMDVVTTSGDGTGIAADIEKIKRIHEGARKNKNARLGIASGITPENVHEYLPYVDDFLVSTGISKDEYELDEEKVRDLLGKIHSYDN